MRIYPMLICAVVFVGGCSSQDDPQVSQQQQSQATPKQEAPRGAPLSLGMLQATIIAPTEAPLAGSTSTLHLSLPEMGNPGNTVSAWCGGPDRRSSQVVEAAYEAADDAYRLAIPTPDPLPGDARWWIEVLQPDGARQVGSLPLPE